MGGNALRGGRVPPASLHQQSHLFIPYIRFFQPILLRNINANHCVFSRGIGVITTSRSGATRFYRCGKLMPVHSNAVTRCCWRWPGRLGKWPKPRRIGSCIASRCRTGVPLSKSTNANSHSDLRYFHTQFGRHFDNFIPCGLRQIDAVDEQASFDFLFYFSWRVDLFNIG